MPDVKLPPPCDYPSISSATFSAGSPAGCSSPLDLCTDMEPCIANLPLSPDPLNSFTQHRPTFPHYPGIQGPPYPLLARCNSSTLLTNLGLRYCSSRHDPSGVDPGHGLAPGSNTGSSSSRPYRSMENLNWNTVADSGLCRLGAAPYRSLDSEFILHYASSSHWYDGPPDGSVLGAHGLVPNPESLTFYPRHGLPRKDLPVLPQLLFPGGVDEWEARKGLRDKLRLQSARSAVEPVRSIPLRPQVTPNAAVTERDNGTSTGAGSRLPCTMRTSPEEIKQEVLRRLQLRRQNSSPNLAVHSSPSRPTVVKTSYTTDNISGNKAGTDPVCERRRPPVGRLHIPTFEEFKKMRQREGKQSMESTAGGVVSVKRGASQDGGDSDTKIHICDQTKLQIGLGQEQRGNLEEAEGVKSTGEDVSRSDEVPQTTTSSETLALNSVTSNCPAAPCSSFDSVTSTYSPIRTGPLPRGPLQPQASSAQEKSIIVGGDDGFTKRRRSSLEPAGSLPFPPSRENWERPSSCCPALLLEGTDLSRYGAKIYKMKDGLIGSALDLIKKR